MIFIYYCLKQRIIFPLYYFQHLFKKKKTIWGEGEDRWKKYVKKNNKREISELREENDALKNELSAFDMSFFDEIEDLKFREKRASELCTLYEQKIKVLENEKLLRWKKKYIFLLSNFSTTAVTSRTFFH